MNKSDFCDLRGAKCRIFGLGKSNEALISYLDKQGAEIFVSDKKKSENEITDIFIKNKVKHAKYLPYNYIEKSDYVFRTPSLRPDAKEINDSIALGAILTSEAQLFFSLAKGFIYGITGSDGKTTTTRITYELLKKSNTEKIFVGGNIGIPLISLLDKLDESSVTVCELSSFQLITGGCSPNCAAITNLTENHLDYHKDISEYILSKTKIYSENNCKKLVIEENCDNIFKKYALYPKNTIICGKDIYIRDNKIKYFGAEILDKKDIRLVGEYNLKNYMTAIGLVYPTVTLQAIHSVAKEFKGVEHRMELVSEKNNIRYYNCSIDSTPSRTVATLSCFKEKNVILILGGYDKKLSYKNLAISSEEKVKKYILYGANKWKIYNTLIVCGVALKNITICSELSEAVYCAVDTAVEFDNVVFSPASASFDMFENFEHRGNEFKNIIKII